MTEREQGEDSGIERTGRTAQSNEFDFRMSLFTTDYTDYTDYSFGAPRHHSSLFRGQESV